MNFRLFTEEGKKKAVITTEEPIDRIAYASETNQFIGWMHKKDSLYVSHDVFFKNYINFSVFYNGS